MSRPFLNILCLWWRKSTCLLYLVTGTPLKYYLNQSGTKNNIAVHHDCPALEWVKKEEGIYCISSGGQVKKGWCRPFSSLLVHYLLSHCDSCLPSSLSHRQNYTSGLWNSTKNPCSEPPTLFCTRIWVPTMNGMLKRYYQCANQVEGKCERHKFPVIRWIHWGLEQGYQCCFADVTIRG